MTTVVEAVYEQGWLKPLKPLLLPEHSRVRFTLTVEVLKTADVQNGSYNQSAR